MGLRAFVVEALPDEPWRNGGGRTRTIATCLRDGVAASVDDPAWDGRISVATIEADGPFSAFPGVDRCSLLMSPGRIELSAPGEMSVQLHQLGDAIAYRGEPRWQAAVRRAGPPLSLLNVMTRRTAARARMQALRGDSVLRGDVLAVIVVEGRWRVVDLASGGDTDGGGVLATGEGAVSGEALSPSSASWRLERLSASGLLAAVAIER